MQSLKKPHLEAAKRILKYSNSTSDIGLFFPKKNDLITGYTDADFGGDLDDRRSISNYILLLAEQVFLGATKSKTRLIYQLRRRNIKHQLLLLKNQECVWLQRVPGD